MLHLEDITPDNWRTPLSVREDQATHVASPMALLARAYAQRTANSRACLLVDGETPVGMALYFDWTDAGLYVLSQFFIDRRYQGRSYGLAGANLLLDEMRRDGRFGGVCLCYVEGENSARRFWEKVGFTRSPEDDDGNELGMRMAL